MTTPLMDLLVRARGEFETLARDAEDHDDHPAQEHYSDLAREFSDVIDAAPAPAWLEATPDGDYLCWTCGALVRNPAQHSGWHAALTATLTERDAA